MEDRLVLLDWANANQLHVRIKIRQNYRLSIKNMSEYLSCQSPVEFCMKLCLITVQYMSLLGLHLDFGLRYEDILKVWAD